jgi:D-alanyl-D-alanine carboxypeptidase/D-alanyl-D-alanine-endopeptidase (penicillin-binding protein 4)
MLAFRSLTPALGLAVVLAASAQTPISHTPFPTGPNTALGAQIDALLADPVAARDHWGIAVTTPDGTPIYGHNEGELYRPASNTKLFTTAAAMALLGPDSTVTTTLSFYKPSANGLSKGDLTISGAGDPSLSAQDFPYQTPAERRALGLPMPDPNPPDPLRSLDAFAADIAKAGVKKIDGDIVGSDMAWTWEPYPIAWDIGDMLTGDGAPVSAMTINDNLLDIAITPAAKVDGPATLTVIPDTGYYQYSVDVKTVAAGTHSSLQIDRAPGSKLVRIYGTIAMGAPYKDEIAIMDPAEFTAMALKQKLELHGIEVTGTARAAHSLPVDGEGFFRESHEPSQLTKGNWGSICADWGCPDAKLTRISPTLAQDVKETLKISQNLHAELMLRRLGIAFGDSSRGHNTTAQGARVVRQFLVNAGLDGDDFLFYDGSGMSSHNLVAPRAAAKLLAYAMSQPWFPTWKAALPVGGLDGSLTSRFPDPPLKGHVFAKTGTLGESRALSGYLDCASGKQVIFSIMVDDHLPGSVADRVTMDKIVAAIAANE